ncbi:hypothetical protein BMS3Bbin10_00010 [bacterium BMS3Bbin10]|nr:hypothetical protein BMS3Bbin10_00010 [bacterium BMS3Bbin10]
MMLGQRKDSQSLGDIVFKPLAELWRLLAIAFDEQAQNFFGYG